LQSEPVVAVGENLKEDFEWVFGGQADERHDGDGSYVEEFGG
jgi:hypothetical protein